MVETEIEPQEEKWPYKLLTREAHGRLVENLSEFLMQAGVREDMIDQSMAESGCAEDEISWVKNFRQSESGGLMVVGKYDSTHRFMAMAAAFLRNFIDARVVHILSLGDDEAIDLPDATVVLIPDLCRKVGGTGMPLPPFRMKQLQSMIMDRYTQQRATVIYVDSLTQFETEHGKSFVEFVEKHWDKKTAK